MSEDTTDNHIEPQQESKPEGMTEQCPDCYRWFKSVPALNMHRVRKHSGKTWSTTGNFAGTDKGAKRKAYKKQYDLKKKAERMAPMTIPDSINFCPECGCNLQIYKVAYATSVKLNETR